MPSNRQNYALFSRQGLHYTSFRLPTFLQQQLVPKEGEIVEIFNDFAEYHKPQPTFNSKQEELEYLSAKINYKREDGKVIGKHQGARIVAYDGHRARNRKIA